MCNSVHKSVIQANTVQRSYYSTEKLLVVQCNSVQKMQCRNGLYNLMQVNTIQLQSVQCRAVKCIIAQYSTGQCSVGQCSTFKSSVMQVSALQGIGGHLPNDMFVVFTTFPSRCQRRVQHNCPCPGPDPGPGPYCSSASAPVLLQRLRTLLSCNKIINYTNLISFANKKIPHTGDTNSLDRCGQWNQYKFEEEA